MEARSLLLLEIESEGILLGLFENLTDIQIFFQEFYLGILQRSRPNIRAERNLS